MLDEDDDNDVEDEDSLASAGNTSSWPEQSTTDLA